jgi:hypothetical protein
VTDSGEGASFPEESLGFGLRVLSAGQEKLEGYFPLEGGVKGAVHLAERPLAYFLNEPEGTPGAGDGRYLVPSHRDFRIVCDRNRRIFHTTTRQAYACRV